MRRSDPRSDPFSRPLDRAVMTLRREFGHNAAIPKFGEGFHAEFVAAVCPLHPTPDVFALELRERGGHGGRLALDCRGGCLPSAILAELRPPQFAATFCSDSMFAALGAVKIPDGREPCAKY